MASEKESETKVLKGKIVMNNRADKTVRKQGDNYYIGHKLVGDEDNFWTAVLRLKNFNHISWDSEPVEQVA